MSNRFHVALSFPGEHRSFVLQVADALAASLTRDRVFYDEWYEAELLGAGGDLKLQSMYEQADLVVPFFSKHYNKPWCSMEWETIRGILLNRRKDDAVIPVHLDDTDVPGWSAVNFGIRLRGRSPQQVADMILQVLATRNPNVANATTATSESAGSPAKTQSAIPAMATESSPSPATGALTIWREKLDYLQRQEAIASDPAQKFTLKKQIEEAKQKIRELLGLEDGRGSGESSVDCLKADLTVLAKRKPVGWLASLVLDCCLEAQPNIEVGYDFDELKICIDEAAQLVLQGASQAGDAWSKKNLLQAVTLVVVGLSHTIRRSPKALLLIASVCEALLDDEKIKLRISWPSDAKDKLYSMAVETNDPHDDSIYQFLDGICER